METPRPLWFDRATYTQETMEAMLVQVRRTATVTLGVDGERWKVDIVPLPGTDPARPRLLLLAAAGFAMAYPEPRPGRPDYRDVDGPWSDVILPSV